jgi:transposase-like protein
MRRGKFTETERASMVADYVSGMSAGEVGRKHGCDHSAVLYLARQVGVPTRTRSESSMGLRRTLGRKQTAEHIANAHKNRERESYVHPRPIHGATANGKRSAEYQALNNAKQRCTNPNNPGWRNYGGRGIEFRFESYEEALQTIGPKPSPRHEIDRIDNDGHYEAGNLRWVTGPEQHMNKRTNRNK